MFSIYKTVGDHTIEILSSSTMVQSFINENFRSVYHEVIDPSIKLVITHGYGTPFDDYHVDIKNERGKIIFRRSDYLIEADRDYRRANIFVHNELALKHAIMNLYSSFIVDQNWGLLIHSSCVIEDGKAHIFAGQSGAGKSTAARLSRPRDLLSDEATLVKITSNEIKVFNSPFRSEIQANGFEECTALESIQILYQALQNKRVRLRKSDAIVHLIDKVFYWAHNPEETKKIIGLLLNLIDKVPGYELYFKKDDTFWELIS